MKCVENVGTGKVLRLTDAEAHEYVSMPKSLWVYVPKSTFHKFIDRKNDDKLATAKHTKRRRGHKN